MLDTVLAQHAFNGRSALTYEYGGQSAQQCSNATSTSYDLVRRPTLVRNHNGNSAAALIGAQRTEYNPLGHIMRQMHQEIEPAPDVRHARALQRAS